ncbi:Gas vesicle protein [Streptomyces sp. DvalAA-14]|uniref:gas vesicle protein GvpJ n=1 Tax=unclassified Streptomyces TaxID=2593676 RepID=UPI00081BB0C3|nr:gas vesicle protein GvpJ [Streptomyces sp. DvalAA-14]MYS21152.1 gas vesicle structural protein GvpA [Streptomyces sp. SID4948]SCD85420.1 Gas vesicle protein [Streptomyces sp. DvalAA-14]
MTVISEEVVYAPRAGTLYDVLELILDRGIVIDVFVRVSLVGIEILKIDARIVVASVDTYLRFAEVCNRVDLANDTASRTVPELFGGLGGVGGAAGMGRAAGRVGARKAGHSLGQKVKSALGADDGDGVAAEEETEPRHRSRSRMDGERSRPRHREESRAR